MAHECTREEQAPAGPCTIATSLLFLTLVRPLLPPGPLPYSYLCLECLFPLLRASAKTAPCSVVFDTQSPLGSFGLLCLPPHETELYKQYTLIRAEVNLLRHNHKWFKGDQSLFLSVSGLWGFNSMNLAIGVHAVPTESGWQTMGTGRPAPST